MLGENKKVLAVAKLLRSRAFAVAVLTVVLAFTVYQAVKMTHTVRIREGNDVQTIHTMDTDPQEILENNGIDTAVEDAVEFSGFYNKVAEISITRAFPVQVVDGGKLSVHMVTGGTVADLLEQADITLDKDDEVDLPMNRTLFEDNVVTITRQDILTREVETELPFETFTIPSSLVAPGKEKVLVEGKAGLQVATYTQLVVDGKKEEEKLKSEEIVQEPVNAEILVGFPSAPVSDLDFGCTFDESGEPEDYVQVLRGQRAAGYSARPGARTAAGYPADVGYVAVNPHVIPYGSKLYIQSEDGGFVYGYAVAADTGTALKNGTIAVDLFYDSYAESAMNGIKYVDIFVLE